MNSIILILDMLYTLHNLNQYTISISKREREMRERERERDKGEK